MGTKNQIVISGIALLVNILLRGFSVLSFYIIRQAVLEMSSLLSFQLSYLF